MKLLILAAGSGKRLNPFTNVLPKILLPFSDGRSLLDSLVDNSTHSGIFEEIVIVIGYGSDLIEEKIKSAYGNRRIRTVMNPEYGDSSPIFSIKVAWESIKDDDFVIINGDTYYGRSIFEKVDYAGKDILALLVSSPVNPCKDVVSVRLDRSRFLKKIKKETLSDNNFISAGFLIVKGPEKRSLFGQAVDRLFNNRDLMWHDLLNKMVSEGQRVDTITVDKGEWHEMDTPEDYRLINDFFKNRV